MAIRETLELDLTRALSQVDDLERQLDSLLQPIEIPVRVDSQGALDQLKRDIRVADTQDIDVDIDTDEVVRAERELSEFTSETRRAENELQDLGNRADATGRDLEQAGRRGTSAFRGLVTSALALGTAFAGFGALRQVFRFFGDAISQASDLQESISKSEVVFGDFNIQIREFARTAPQALGLSTAAALEFTATFGNLFVALGLTQDAAAGLAPEIVQLGADLASFNNISVDDALTSLRSGLVGEVEPLRRLGVAINAATVEAKALELGLVGSNGEVSEAAKVQARYALILEQTTTAQGDFARTADGVANRQRTVAAEFANAKAALGDALLPVYEELLALAPKLIEGLTNLEPSIRAVSAAFAEGVGDADGFVAGLGKFAVVLPGALGAVGDLLGVLGALGRATDPFFALRLSGETFNNVVDGITSAVDRINVNKIKVGLVDALNAGVPPAVALQGALKRLSEKNLDIEDVERLSAAFAQIAGVNAGELLDVIDKVERLGVANGVAAEEVDAMVTGLSTLFNRPTDQGLERELRWLKDAKKAAEDAAPALFEAATDLDRLNLAAASAGQGLLEYLQTAEQLPPGTEEFAQAVLEANKALKSQIDSINDTNRSLSELPTILADARDALKDEEGKIVEDFATFLANLEDQFAATADFQTNLDLLRALGLDDLAALFEQVGPDAAAALDDAVAQAFADPAALADAEAALEAQIAEQVRVVQEQARRQLASEILTLPVELQLAQLQIPNIQAALNIGPIGGGQGVGDIIININNPTTQDLNTDANRAVQEIDAVRTRNLIR